MLKFRVPVQRKSRKTIKIRWRELAVTLVRDAPRWLFLAALVFAPWYYGGTSGDSIIAINAALAAVFALWLVAILVRRRFPVVPIALWFAGATILAFGWFMTWNARALCDSEFGIFAPIKSVLPNAPGSIDGLVAATSMIRISSLIGVIWFVADLARRPEWLLRIWMTIGVAGGSIALLGLLQRATGAVLPYWQYQPWEYSTFFATYYYHANAGAFLNLVFPPAVGLTIRAFQRHDSPVQRALWATATLLLITAIFTNTSRAAQLLAFIGFVLLVISVGRKMRLRAAENRVAVAVASLIIGLALLVIAQASGIVKGFERWRGISQELPASARWAAEKVAFFALPKAGWTGFGPGTFNLAFPYFEDKYHLDPTTGPWEFLHEDYLQTLLEWGWIGGALWGAIFFGGIAVGIFALQRLKQYKSATRLSRFLPLLLIGLTVTALHSLVDFPLQVQSLRLYVATYLGVCWASLSWMKTQSPKATTDDLLLNH